MATEEVPPAEQRKAMKEVEAEAEAEEEEVQEATELDEAEEVPPTEQRGAMKEVEAEAAVEAAVEAMQDVDAMQIVEPWSAYASEPVLRSPKSALAWASHQLTWASLAHTQQATSRRLASTFSWPWRRGE